MNGAGWCAMIVLIPLVCVSILWVRRKIAEMEDAQ